MDQGRIFLIVAISAGLLGCGCGQSANTGQAGPDHVVAEFLEAVRAGDDEKAARLLTPLARQKTSEMEMVVAPPGSETAKYQVLGVELVGKGAQVASDWTELDNDGRPHTDRIVWMLRNEPEGWRIAGMSTRVFADQAPIELNFEDPADMLRKQQLAEDEIARRDRQPESSETHSGDDTPGAVR